MHFAKPLTALKIAGIATLYTFSAAAIALAAGLPTANAGSGTAAFDAAYGSDNAKMRLAAAYTASVDAEALSDIRPLRYSHGAATSDIRPLRYSHGAATSDVRPLRYSRNKTAEGTLQLADNSDL